MQVLQSDFEIQLTIHANRQTIEIRHTQVLLLIPNNFFQGPYVIKRFRNLVLDHSYILIKVRILEVNQTTRLKDQIKLDHTTREYVCNFQSFG